MLRSLLVGVLALSTASACKGTSDAPAVQPGVAVGKVVEMNGEVSATRGSAKRTLASGQEISGDDVIETGEGANVRILFAHNNATWELGPKRTQLVSESLAWKLPKQDGSAAKVDEATLAAGRHAERETVTTKSTAPTEAPSNQAAPAAPSPVTAPSPGAMPDPTPPPEKSAPAPGGSGGPGGKRGGKIGQDKGARESRPQNTESASDEFTPKGGEEKKADAPLKSAVEAPAAVVKKRIAEAREMLGACMKTNTLAVVVVVDQGITSFELPKGSSTELENCFKIAATRINFPESYTLRVKTSLTK